MKILTHNIKGIMREGKEEIYEKIGAKGGKSVFVHSRNQDSEGGLCILVLNMGRWRVTMGGISRGG